MEKNTTEMECEETLPDGCSWNPTIMDQQKEVHDKKGILLSKLGYKQDKLNGRCKYYENGYLVKEVTYNFGIKHGWECEYEFGDNPKECYYENGEKKGKLRKSERKEGYYDEIDCHTGEINSICMYNEEHERDGKRYIFKNGTIDKIVMYEHGKEKYNMKKFKEGIMKEYDENGKKVYKGGYLNSLEKEYPREGQGEEYCDEVMIYEGEWKDGMRNGKGTSLKNGLVYYSGMWKDELPEGEGKMYENGKLEYAGDNWVKGILDLGNSEVVEYDGEKRKELKVIVRSEFDWKNLSKEVTELVIDERVCNDMEGDVVIEGFDYLKSILVKKNSMKHVNRMKICNCTMLEKIETETEAFENVNSLKISSLIDLIQLI